MQIKRFLAILFLFSNICLPQTMLGQRLITGKVLSVNSKLPVENVAVTVFKGTNSVQTNQNGYFQMTIEEEDSLIFTHPDYKSGGLKPPEVNVFVIYMEQYHYYPDYIGGNEALYLYLQSHLKYPRKARSRRLEGLVFVEVQIDSTGSIVACKALGELCKDCNPEIVDVFKAIPGKWHNYDEPVIKSFLFPLEYRIENDTEIETQLDAKVLQGKVMPKIVLTAFVTKDAFR